MEFLDDIDPDTKGPHLILRADTPTCNGTVYTKEALQRMARQINNCQFPGVLGGPNNRPNAGEKLQWQDASHAAHDAEVTKEGLTVKITPLKTDPGRMLAERLGMVEFTPRLIATEDFIAAQEKGQPWTGDVSLISIDAVPKPELMLRPSLEALKTGANAPYYASEEDWEQLERCLSASLFNALQDLADEEDEDQAHLLYGWNSYHGYYVLSQIVEGEGAGDCEPVFFERDPMRPLGCICEPTITDMNCPVCSSEARHGKLNEQTSRVAAQLLEPKLITHEVNWALVPDDACAAHSEAEEQYAIVGIGKDERCGWFVLVKADDDAPGYVFYVQHMDQLALLLTGVAPGTVERPDAGNSLLGAQLDRAEGPDTKVVSMFRVEEKPVPIDQVKAENAASENFWNSAQGALLTRAAFESAKKIWTGMPVDDFEEFVLHAAPTILRELGCPPDRLPDFKQMLEEE